MNIVDWMLLLNELLEKADNFFHSHFHKANLGDRVLALRLDSRPTTRFTCTWRRRRHWVNGGGNDDDDDMEEIPSPQPY